MTQRTRFRFPESLIRRMSPQPNGCIYFTGYVDRQGYGKIRREGEARLAHRVSFEHFVGPIPEGMDLDHQCHNDDPACPGGVVCLHRRCLNPEHLKPATRSDNLAGGARRTGRCKRGHEFTDENTSWEGTSRRCRQCRRDAVNGRRRKFGR